MMKNRKPVLISGLLAAAAMLMLLSSCATTPSGGSAGGETEIDNVELSDAVSRDTGRMWTSLPENGKPVFIGLGPNMFDDDAEEDAALRDAARQAAMYLKMYGSTGFLDSRKGQFSFLEIEFDESRIDSIAQKLEILDKEVFSEGTVIRASFPGKNAPFYGYNPVPRGKISGSNQPVWVYQIPVIPGYIVSVGVSAKKSTVQASFIDADRAAIADMLMQVSTSTRAGDLEQATEIGEVRTSVSSHRASGTLEGFYILARWQSGDGKTFYSLAVSPEKNKAKGDTEQYAGIDELPAWVLEYPIEPDYYVGVGSSNVGDRGTDMEQARLRALASLASSISTKIESEIVVDTVDDSEGNYKTQLTEKIRQNVQQNLKGVEPVDSFYSPAEGYWFYFRFAKAELENMKDALRQRVTQMAESTLSGTGTIAEKIAILWDGYNMIQESPFVGTIQSTVQGNTGALTDILAAEIGRLTASLTLSAEPADAVLEQGETPVFNLLVSSSLGIATGQLHCILFDEGSEIASVVTDQNGYYNGQVDVSEMELGRRQLVWTVDFSRLGIDQRAVRVFALKHRFLWKCRGCQSVFRQQLTAMPRSPGFSVPYLPSLPIIFLLK